MMKSAGRSRYFLSGKPDDQTDERAGQDDLEIVTTLQRRDDVRQNGADHRTKHDPDRQ